MSAPSSDDPSTPSDRSPGDEPPPVPGPAAAGDGIFDRVADRFGDLLPLALVPLVTGLAAVDDLVALAEGPPGGAVSFGLPNQRVDAWTFLDGPSGGSGVNVDVAVPGLQGVEALPLVIALFGLYVVVSGLLTAGYFGGIRNVLDGERIAFVASVRRYGARCVGYELILLGALFALFAPLFVSPALALLVFPGLLLLAYLFYPTLYLVVLRDRPLAWCFRRAYALTTGPEPTGLYFVGFVLATAAVSLPMNVLARGSLSAGVAVAIVAAPLGLSLNALTMVKVATADRADLDARGPEPSTE